MDISKMRRNPQAVLAGLKALPNGALATTQPLHIHVPETFRAKSILQMGEEILTMGYIALVLDSGEYGVYMIPSMIRLNPSQTTMIEVDGKAYYDFSFDAGTIVFKSIELLKDNSLLYNVTDELLSRGRIPWYYGYEDMAEFFKSIAHYTGTQLVPVRSVGEMVVAQVARLPTKRTDPLRYHLTKAGVNVQSGVSWLPLRNVSIGAEGFAAKFVGSYLDDGIDSALLSQGGKRSNLEEVLRA